MIHDHRVRWRRGIGLGRLGLAILVSAISSAVTGNVTGSSAVEAGHFASLILRRAWAVSLRSDFMTRFVGRRRASAKHAELLIHSFLHFLLPFPLLISLSIQEAVHLSLKLGAQIGLLRPSHSVWRSAAIIGIVRPLIGLQTQCGPVCLVQVLRFSLAYFERELPVSHRFQEGILRDDLRRLVGRLRVGQDHQSSDLMQQVAEIFFRALTAVVQLGAEGFCLAFRPVSLAESFNQFFVTYARLSAEVPEKLRSGLL